MSASLSVSASDAVVVNATVDPALMVPSVSAMTEKLGAWFTLNGEPVTPEPWLDEEWVECGRAWCLATAG